MERRGSRDIDVSPEGVRERERTNQSNRRTETTLKLSTQADRNTEAGAGIEPANSGFADRDLTTWLPRQRASGQYQCSGACIKHRWPVDRRLPQAPRQMSSSSAELFARAQKRIPGGVNSPVRAFRGLGGEPFFVERAQGSRIWTVDARELIEYVGSWGPAILGHAHPKIVSAVCDAAQRGVSFGIPNPL